MNKSPPIDAVDRILAQWQRERPDLDCSPMGPIGRLKRCAMLLEPQVEVAFTRHDLVRWEFDMLATLRRAGSGAAGVDATAGNGLTASGDKVAVGADRHHAEKQSHGKEDQRQTAEDLHQRNQPGPRAVIRGQSFDRPMARIVNQ